MDRKKSGLGKTRGKTSRLRDNFICFRMTLLVDLSRPSRPRVLDSKVANLGRVNMCFFGNKHRQLAVTVSEIRNVLEMLSCRRNFLSASCQSKAI